MRAKLPARKRRPGFQRPAQLHLGEHVLIAPIAYLPLRTRSAG